MVFVYICDYTSQAGGAVFAWYFCIVSLMLVHWYQQEFEWCLFINVGVYLERRGLVGVQCGLFVCVA